MAFEPNIDFLAATVAAIAYFVLGWLWYTPIFGKLWAKHMGLPMDTTPTAKQMTTSLVNHLVGCVLTAIVFAHVMAAFGAANYATGAGPITAAGVNDGLDHVTMGMALEGAGWTWLGFFLPLQAGRAAWEGRSWTLVAINAGYNLVGLAVIAVILQAWP